MREHAKLRSPSPIRRMLSVGEKGIVGWVCCVWWWGFGLGFEVGVEVFEIEAGRVSVLGALPFL